MADDVIEHCDFFDTDYLRAAKSCIELAEGKKDPERARADFIKAMTLAGVFVRER